MTDNPYDSPSSTTAVPALEPHRGTTARPVGISILVVLHFIGGIVLVGAQFFLLANLQVMGETLRSLGIPLMSLMLGVFFLAILAIASSIGMWIGAKWGWWLGSFYYVFGILRNGLALLTVIAMADQLEGTSRGTEYFMIKHGGRVIVHFLLFLYFFKGNVLAYFGLTTLRKAKAIGIFVGICIAIVAATAAIRLLSH